MADKLPKDIILDITTAFGQKGQKASTQSMIQKKAALQKKRRTNRNKSHDNILDILNKSSYPHHTLTHPQIHMTL